MGQFFEEYSLRFRSWGREIGCTYAEALVSPGRLAVADLSQV